MMKLIYYVAAIALFSLASFAAPTTRVMRQTDKNCTSNLDNIDFEAELKTGLRIFDDLVNNH